MRTRSEIELAGNPVNMNEQWKPESQAVVLQQLQLETLLDIRDLLTLLQPTMVDMLRKHHMVGVFPL